MRMVQQPGAGLYNRPTNHLTTRRKHYDIAIIGLGTMGSFAAVELAKRGCTVAAFDQFTPPHGRGSHSGATRIYRVAYAEGTGYVPLAQRAGELWDRASEELGRPLLHRTGMLYMGPRGDGFLREVAGSASDHHLAVETLTAGEVFRRYPAFEIPDYYAGLIDTQAGWIDVDASITSSLAEAKRFGVECFFDRPVKGWNATAGETQVHLEGETISANGLIITAGAWAGDLLRGLGLPLKVKRKVLAWFDPSVPEIFDRMPIFAFADDWTYGFPNVPGMGVKMAVHAGGSYLADADSPVQPAGPDDLDPLVATAAKYMPRLGSRVVRTATCLYTMTPDDDFIVDRHPEFKNVAFAVGFSGHGFKFAPVIAEALADLVLEGKTVLPVGFLALDRLYS
jgi:sarcosine oxidase